MSFEFTEGPKMTSKSVQQVAAVVKEVGQERRFMSFTRRLGIKANNNVSMGFASGGYGAFQPKGDDDPFASAEEAPAWSVGWGWNHSVTNSLNMTLNQGWTVIFRVYDDGGSRRVVARAEGSSQRREVKKFIESVFQLL